MSSLVRALAVAPAEKLTVLKFGVDDVVLLLFVVRVDVSQAKSVAEESLSEGDDSLSAGRDTLLACLISAKRDTLSPCPMLHEASVEEGACCCGVPAGEGDGIPSPLALLDEMEGEAEDSLTAPLSEPGRDAENGRDDEGCRSVVSFALGAEEADDAFPLSDARDDGDAHRCAVRILCKADGVAGLDDALETFFDGEGILI